MRHSLAQTVERDPFAVLGPHRDEGDGAVIRTVQPAARAVAVRLVATGETLEMVRRDREGLYEVRFLLPSAVSGIGQRSSFMTTAVRSARMRERQAGQSSERKISSNCIRRSPSGK